jgi:Cytochrome c oxidase subunit IV
MATENDDVPERALAQPTEQIHLPEPSYIPVVLAFGISIAVVGVVLTWVMVLIGAIIAVIAIFRWIRLTRSEMSQLPLGH